MLSENIYNAIYACLMRNLWFIKIICDILADAVCADKNSLAGVAPR